MSPSNNIKSFLSGGIPIIFGFRIARATHEGIEADPINNAHDWIIVHSSTKDAGL